jgi:hypothetical protein
MVMFLITSESSFCAGNCQGAAGLPALCLKDLAYAVLIKLIGNLKMPERFADHERNSSSSTDGAMF